MFLTALRSMKLAIKTVPPTGGSHTATVIIFHGSGDTAGNFTQYIKFLLGKEMDFPHAKIIYPTAPLQPYTPAGGELSNVWFDRNAISIEAKENRTSLASIYPIVSDLVKNEVDHGIPENRIVVGGFSMGGAMAMHLAYHLNKNLAGAFAMSSFLNRGSIVYESLNDWEFNQQRLPELLMFHGDRDSLVPASWGEESFRFLKGLGVKGDFRIVKNTLHELKKGELEELQQWIHSVIPEIEEKSKNLEDF